MNDKPELLLHALVDGELELTRQLALEAQVDADPELQAQLQRLREQREQLRGEASYHPAPAELRAHVQAALAGSVRAPAASRIRFRIAWPSFAAGLATMALLFAVGQASLLSWREDASVQEEALASHARAVLSGRMIDVASSDHHTVKPWLSARLDFSPPLGAFADGTTQLLGARVDYLGGRPAAALVLAHGGHTAEWFVRPASGADRPVRSGSERGFQVAQWQRAGMAHVLLSDLNPREFAGLVQQLRAQP